MERIALWRNELQGARLYDGRAKDRFSWTCAALQANSGTSFSAACAGGHHAPSEDGVRAHWFGQVSAWRAGAYVLAVGRDGVPLDVIGQKCWVRADADFAKTARRRQMPIKLSGGTG